MVDLLFWDLSEGGEKESLDTEIDHFTDKELHACYRFGRDSFFITSLLVGDIQLYIF